MTEAAPVHRSGAGPLAPSQRSLAPDLARGVMLLFIALANTHLFLPDRPLADLSLLDRGVKWATTTFVDARSFPMFGLLFGYGIARIVARQKGSPKQTRKLLRRRSLVLLVIGSLHMAFLFEFEILATYGALLFIGLWAVHWRGRTLMLVAWLSLLLLGVMLAALGSFGAADSGMSEFMAADSYAESVGQRLTFLPMFLAVGWFMFVCPYLVGLWAGRRRVLERAADHRRLLQITAAAGIAVAVLGAQPLALSGVLPDWPAPAMAQGLHQVSGTLGGFGYAALVALMALRMEASRGRLTEALAATGQRSMTCYLMQSPVWFIVFSPFLLDLSGSLSISATAALAATTWLGTLIFADRQRARGKQGPFELMTRRLTYGPKR